MQLMSSKLTCWLVPSNGSVAPRHRRAGPYRLFDLSQSPSAHVVALVGELNMPNTHPTQILVRPPKYSTTVLRD